MGIGERMKEARKSKHISRVKMAQMTGMSESTLKGWEHNAFPLSFLQLWHFLKATDMTFEELMEGK